MGYRGSKGRKQVATGKSGGEQSLAIERKGSKKITSLRTVLKNLLANHTTLLLCIQKQSFWPILLTMGTRGIIGDKWSMRILWACAIGSAVSLYMVAVERQAQNRERMLAEELRAMESGESNGGDG
ncbi:hypothetical protein E2542_SST09421 [Spatholobus suberectus]|nr:hypothetical protein E2542_SST09421 [Spatholobus suberectus]